ncbi:EF-hand calcium-binding domain-containing protein 5-like isoform X2 [Anneissia japonica]|uniref:EF-hand calcium-binding domain-containing protein 5-like isoform X2 n=1 Tax=Anneissia japonica TaxID=1529436 RepID=UPI001425B650|nr:EF-hand calcium-binding domain-containing protein 5-like isoform X2 [Anneissia japonica]
MAGVETISSPPVGANVGRMNQGSRPSSRVGFIEARPHSRQGSQCGSPSPTSDVLHPRPPSHPRSGSDRGSPSFERPPSVRSLRSKAEMAEHLSPIVKSAVRRWKRFHEQRVFERFKMRKNAKDEHIRTVKEEKLRLARKIPIDVLALEWMNRNEVTVETRAYLLDKLLPTLILGVEKLLTEVEKKGLADTTDPNPNFNPINYLAQYLMRNNPRYSNFPEASPYIRGLKDVTDELKEHVFSFEDNRLARAKAEARKRREEQQRIVQQKQIEQRLRSARIKDNLKEWMRNSEGKLEMRLLQSSLQSFVEILQQMPDELQQASKFTIDIEPVDNPDKKVTPDTFSEFLKKHVKDMPVDIFTEFMKHMTNCATAFCKSNEKELQRSLLSNLFKRCDHTNLGILDRHRVIALLESFWDNANWSIKCLLRNPRKWPVIEIDEEDDSESVATEGSIPYSQSNVDECVSGIQSVSRDIQQEDGEQQKVSESTEKPKDEEAETKKDADNTLDNMEKQEVRPTGEGENIQHVTNPVDQEPKPEASSKDTAVLEEEVSDEKELPEQKDTVEEKESVGEQITELKEETTEQEAIATREATSDEKTSTPQPAAEEKIEKTPVQQESKVDVDESQQTKPHEEAQPTDTEGEVPAAEATIFEKQGDKTEDQSEIAKEPIPKTATSIGQTSVSFRDDVASPKTNQSYGQSNRSGSVTTSAFDEHTLNQSQFTQLIEVFLGDEMPDGILDELMKFIREGYVETEDEKMKRMRQARQAVQTAKRRHVMDQLFDRWDNDGSGFLDLDELLTVLTKFKENMESKVIKNALTTLNKKDGDMRLNKVEFQTYIKAICEQLPGGDDNFDPLMEFLMTSVERSYEERIRGQARKKWLGQIVQSAQTSGASLGPVFKAVFNALYKDAEQHGHGKRISANIALLENNDLAPHRGPTLLRYVAATADDAHFMLGKSLYRDMRGISFSSVDTGKPLHVPRVQNHGNIMFFNNDRSDEDRQGSFIVIPLKDLKRNVFGTMGIDTLNDPQEKSIFITHEISFFQGVGKAFSTAYNYIDIRRKTLRIAESAISWIHRRSPHVVQVNVFIVEPDEKLEDFVLRKMLTTDRHGNTTTHDNPQKLERKENLFRDYLFKCVDNSETVAADAYGERHMAFPLRDPDGRAVAVVDISIGDLKELPNHENKEVQRMLKLLQTAHKEVSQESAGGDKTIVLEAEKDSEQNRIDIMFDRIMLMDLRENVGKLNARAFAELKSYKEPPKVIHDIVVSVLTLFFQDKSEAGELEQWNNCKQLISSDLINKIGEFDPTASEAVNSVQKIAGRLKDVPHGAVAKHGSLPAQQLYNWAFVCLSLLEHSKKMNDKRPGVTQVAAPTPQSDAVAESC